MLPVIWRAKARASLATIVSFVATESPAAARRLHTAIEESIVPAAQYPYLYRTGRVPCTREVIAHPNYVLIYRVTGSGIEVLDVLHTRQQYPPPKLK